MTKILKKSLACLLVFALCFTAIASCLAVSAAAPAAGFDYKTYFPNDSKVWAVCAGQNVRAQLSMTDLEAGATIGLSIEIPKGAEITSIDGWNWGTNCQLKEVSKYFNEEDSVITIIYDVVASGNYMLFVRYNITDAVAKGVRFMDVTFEAAFASDDEITEYTVTDYYEVFDHDVVTDDAVAPGCETTGLTEGSHCSRCGLVLEAQEEVEATGHKYVDGKCEVCGNPDPDYVPAECEHSYGVAYMDQATHTWHKDCVKCDDKIDAEANVITGKLIAAKIVCLEKVGANITINNLATNGVKQLGYSDFYIEVAYQYYGDGYTLQNNIYKRTSSQYDFLDSNDKVNGYTFTEIALYEMGYEFTINLYCLDAEGKVVATIATTTSIPTLARADMEKYSSDTKLITYLTDMLSYGAAMQEFFAAKNPGTDITRAELPTKGFEDYIEAYGSTREDLPAEFNTTLTRTPIKSGTTIAVGTPVLKTEASNSISYTIKANAEYDESKLKVVATYTDGYGRPISDEVYFTDLEEGVQGGNRVYTYIFSKLALFDVRKTVNITIYYDGEPEYSCDYCASQYTQKYINNAELGPGVVALELFTQSLADKLFS